MKKEIAHGAEAVLILDEREGETVLVKDRVKKGYRLPELDHKIRKQRTKHEDSLLHRAARAGVSTPRVFDSSENKLASRRRETSLRTSQWETKIVMEFIDGDRVKDVFNEMDEKERAETATLIGESLGKLHSASIVHGDFTTSNMLLKKETTDKEGRGLKWSEKNHARHPVTAHAPLGHRLFIIDFGLGKFSRKIEDQAVDLYLLYEALKAAHFTYLNEAWQNILKSYRQHYAQAPYVLKRFEKIEKRRRYKGE